MTKVTISVSPIAVLASYFTITSPWAYSQATHRRLWHNAIIQASPQEIDWEESLLIVSVWELVDFLSHLYHLSLSPSSRLLLSLLSPRCIAIWGCISGKKRKLHNPAGSTQKPYFVSVHVCISAAANTKVWELNTCRHTHTCKFMCGQVCILHLFQRVTTCQQSVMLERRNVCVCAWNYEIKPAL